MFLRSFLFVVLSSTIVGCGKDDGGATPAPTPAVDPNATYTIKVRDKQKGDKYQVTESGSSSLKKNWESKGKKQSEEASSGYRFAYTEDVIAIAPGSDRPSKANRVYTAAELTQNGKTVPLSFQGKTVDIDLSKSDRFRIENGPVISKAEAPRLTSEFLVKRLKQEDYYPSKPVKLNEPWDLNKAKLFPFLQADFKVALDAAKSTATGTLTKVYSRDGKQFGVIEIQMNLLPVEYGAAKLKPESKIAIDATSDICIDGSAFEGDIKSKVSEVLLTVAEVRYTLEGTEERSVKSLK